MMSMRYYVSGKLIRLTAVARVRGTAARPVGDGAASEFHRAVMHASGGRSRICINR